MNLLVKKRRKSNSRLGEECEKHDMGEEDKFAEHLISLIKDARANKNRIFAKWKLSDIDGRIITERDRATFYSARVILYHTYLINNLDKIGTKEYSKIAKRSEGAFRMLEYFTGRHL